MNKNNYAIIMAGGVGSRFWPWSKTEKPKQFLDVLGTGKTLIQQTYERINRICPKENILIITNALYAQTIAEQITDIPRENILSEPKGRNTAPCIAFGAFKIHRHNPNANILVAPSDHVILKEDLFVKVVEEAFDYARENEVLMTIGIDPHKPETGYGYIQSTGEILKSSPGEWQLSEVTAFREKPNLEKAKEFLESGDYFWNAGIFVWSVRTIIRSFEKHLPTMYSQFDAFETDFNTKNEEAAVRTIFNQCESISIDYGIMEKAKNVCVMSTDIGWSDMGSWSALHEVSDKNNEGNASNTSKSLFYNSKNVLLRALDDKVTVIEGLEDYIVVEEENALLICRKQNEQLIKQFVKDVGDKFGEDYI
jgi:mannose-1-phosphate guanylyltransferase